jgi:hypothetical protein
VPTSPDNTLATERTTECVPELESGRFSAKTELTLTIPAGKEATADHVTDVQDVESTDEDGHIPLRHRRAHRACGRANDDRRGGRRARLRRAAASQDVGLLLRLWEAIKRPFRGLPDDIDPTDVTAAWWAVVLRCVAVIGRPEVISFEFQTLLDMNYAVGRIAFDQREQYRRCVEGLIAYETAAAVPNGREVLYWRSRNRADRATQ